MGFYRLGLTLAWLSCSNALSCLSICNSKVKIVVLDNCKVQIVKCFNFMTYSRKYLWGILKKWRIPEYMELNTNEIQK